ncbi:MAG TPA: RNA polymerase sigma factor [Myxococcota bacterium]|nr:RNA polymerase sigma factor [Myxococcota bacterium]
MTSRPEEDWAAVLERLLRGDRLALAQLTRLINSFLARWNAYDFRDEWDDLIQEVLLAAAAALRDGRIRDRAAVVGFLKSTARFKFADRLKAHLRLAEDANLPWQELLEGPLEPAEDAGSTELRRDLREALARLPEKEREAVAAVHVEGRTYEDAAAKTGIPLGSLKRHLRDGLARLRAELDPLLGGGS